MSFSFDNKPKFIQYSLLVLLFIGFNSCASKAKVVEDDQEASTQAETPIDENMKAATLVDYSERDNACSLLLILEEDGNILQPLSIGSEFQNDGTKVWIDFSYSRRKQGPCSYGTPIVINKITKRLE